MQSSRWRTLLLLAVIALPALLAACRSSDGQGLKDLQGEMGTLRQQISQMDRRVEDMQSRLDQVQRAARVGQVAAAIQMIDAIGIHAMNESLQNGKLDPTWTSAVRNAVWTAGAIEWPEELHTQAEAFLGPGRDLADALASGEAAAAAEASEKAHGPTHNLTFSGFQWLANASTRGSQNGGAEGAVESDVHEQEGSGQEAHEEPDSASGPSGQEIPETARRITIELGPNGAPVGGLSTHRVDSGDTVAFILQSHVKGSFHIHGYDEDWQLSADGETIGVLEADATGRFPLEIHVPGQEKGIPGGYLEVHP